MNLHPLLLAVAVVDGVALLLLLVSARTAVEVVLAWASENADQRQLGLEARFDVTSILTGAGALLFLLSSLGLVVAVAWVLPGLIPGAMCGTGVLSATSGVGGRALALRALTVLVLGIWHTLHRLDRSEPRSSLALGVSRTVLLAVPLMVVAVVDTARAFARLTVDKPVSCCAAIYDQVQGSMSTSSGRGELWAVLTGAGGALLVVAGFGLWRAGARLQRQVSGPTALLSVAWVVVAQEALIEVFASYHYGVLYHHCPWCLLLPEHHGVGFVAFGALGWVLFEGAVAWLCLEIAGRGTAVADSARARAR